MATTEIILREKIENLGAEADVVTVKSGYARNYLIPQGKAFEATKGNLRHLEHLKQVRTRRESDELNTARSLAAKINKLKPKFILETGQGGRAFGSVTSMDLHKDLAERGIEIDRHTIKLEKPLKQTGKSEIEIRLHPEVTATLHITVEAHTKDDAAQEEPR